MRRVFILGALALFAAACEDRGEVVGAERPGEQAVAPGQGQPGGVMIGVTVMDTEPVATARLLAATQAIAQAELNKAELAVEKASSEEVRAFARALVDEHRADLQKIGELAQRNKLDVQGAFLADAQVRARQAAAEEELTSLRSLSGAGFDAAFMRPQPQEHIMLEHIGEQGQRVSTNVDIDGFFASIVTKAQSHRAAAERILPATCLVIPGEPTQQQGQAP